MMLPTDDSLDGLAVNRLVSWALSIDPHSVLGDDLCLRNRKRPEFNKNSGQKWCEDTK